MYNPLGILLQGPGPASPQPTPPSAGTDRVSAACIVLDQRMLNHTSRNVTYSRGSYSVTLAATPGRSDYDIVRSPNSDVLEHVQTRDYMIRTADLILNGALTRPAVGDRVTDTDGVFEVTAPGGVNQYEFSDPAYRRMMRIHTKRIEEV